MAVSPVWSQSVPHAPSIVEEASEVLEPLLFACLCQSTVKLQLIGDHLQLQPSLMDKFDFKCINKVNVSMFERLITAPDQHRVPSGVLSVQWRMRRDICDITREYYTDIVAIEDHPVCATKTLPGQEAQLSFWTGREIPGVRSHLYLWTHTGTQERADVGVSKQNKQEGKFELLLSQLRRTKTIHCNLDPLQGPADVDSQDTSKRSE